MGRALSLTLFTLLASTSMTAQADEFYANNDITIVVGFSPGGGYDGYARMLARHMGKHIPGNPNIIVQNMPGAGSQTAVRHLDAIAPTDGSVIVAFNPGLIVSSLADPETVSLDLRDYTWLGSASRELRVCYTWRPSGIGSWEELLEADEVILGATGPGSANYTDGAILHNVLGVNIVPISGFPGSAEINLALEQGEVDLNCGSWTSVGQNIREDENFVPLVKLADVDDPDLPDDLPFYGVSATTDEQIAILNMMADSSIIGRPYILSHEVPEERVEILREAFEATLADPEFLADAESMSFSVTGAISGSEAQEVVERLYGADPALLESVRAAMEM